MASTRLPGKPLADIAGKPMIVHVMDRAIKADIGPVYIAAAEKEIADVVEKVGGKAVLTDPSHPSGTDRIFEALKKIDRNNKYNIVINVQGDLPTLDPQVIRDILKPHENDEVDISTLIAEIKDEEERNNPNVVKAVVSFQENKRMGRALNFTRSAPKETAFHHIGIYSYKIKALERFTTLAPSPMEKKEKLEQLRALENGMRIDAVLVNTIPLGVDSPEDLKKAREILKRHK